MAHEQLRVTDGEEGGRRLSVDGELLIGRGAPGDDGRLGQDPELSRLHARLTRDAEGRLTIEDLGSANGTFVNDEPIDTPRTLAAGDVVRMGRTVLQVTDSSGAVPEPPQRRPRSGPGAGGHRRQLGGPPAHAGRRAHPRPRGERRRGAERRPRAVPPPRPGCSRRRRTAHDRGPRVGQRHVRERRPRARPPAARAGRHGANRLHHAAAGRGRAGAGTCGCSPRSIGSGAPAPGRAAEASHPRRRPGAAGIPAPAGIRLRGLSRGAGHRPRGHGRGLPGRGAGAGAPGRTQAHPAGALRTGALPRALSARGGGRGRDRPPKCHSDLRRGR